MREVFSTPLPRASGVSKRAANRIRAAWRCLRIDRAVTAALGPQYRRSRDSIEIELTWACNLSCLNCNRSVRQAPTGEHMTVAQIDRFLEESRERGNQWRKVRLLGGEPSLHPDFLAIVDRLDAARGDGTVGEIQVSTNGHGERVRAAIARVRDRVTVDNSAKESDVQPHFGDFNVAPRDLPGFRRSAYRNGCWVIEGCGMGLTPYGFYPCAVAGGIDRVLGLGLGRLTLPFEEDDMEEDLEALCAWCGRFRTGHFVPRDLRPAVQGEPMTKSWQDAYAAWREVRPELPRYGA